MKNILFVFLSLGKLWFIILLILSLTVKKIKEFFLKELINYVQSIVVPRFDARDKDGIIFYPILPRAGQPLTAEWYISKKSYYF